MRSRWRQPSGALNPLIPGEIQRNGGGIEDGIAPQYTRNSLPLCAQAALYRIFTPLNPHNDFEPSKCDEAAVIVILVIKKT